jgi:hypothetical protein
MVGRFCDDLEHLVSEVINAFKQGQLITTSQQDVNSPPAVTQSGRPEHQPSYMAMLVLKALAHYARGLVQVGTRPMHCAMQASQWPEGAQCLAHLLACCGGGSPVH